MRVAFADSLYWIAIVKPNDPWKKLALDARRDLGNAILVTTDEVLSEFLAALSKGGGPPLRDAGVKMVRAIMANPNVNVIPQTHDGFLKGLDRYDNRRDKQYSLTDCISMNVMEAESIQDVLSNDHHFSQEGFNILIKKG